MSKAMSKAARPPINDPGLDSPEARQRKRYMVELFGYQAPKYDFHDDVIGLGIHRWWARDIIKAVGNFMQGRNSARMLDLACGTGFVTFNVAKRFENIDIDGFDISPEMVAVARKRYREGFKDRNIELWVGDAELPCGEGRYDIVTTCFAFRNFANKSMAVDNVFKALKSGGIFILQDMTKPERQPFRGTYLFALRYLLPIVAKILGTEKGAARYLYNSVQLMPRNAEIKALLESTGFTGVSCKGQTMGIGCIVVGNKPGI
jgi:demethylmenaquinone methyltransferase/2-methoxy-6-polyprenyl-1,4-benzoquinol methylase